MRHRRAMVVLALIAVLAALAGTASAERRWIVAGTLDAVDEESRVVEVSSRAVRITPRTVIRRADGTAGTWDDVVDREGEYVSLLVAEAHPLPVAKTIVLADPVEDADED